MKYKKLLIIFSAFLLLFTSACGKSESKDHQTPDSGSASQTEINSNGEISETDVVKIFEEKSFDYENYDWEKYIREIAFDKNTKIGSEALKVLEIETTEVTKETVTFKIKAPYIKDELISRVNENYKDTNSLENEILALLKSEKKEYSFTLNYFASFGKEPHVDFTSSFSNAVTCGILEFSAEMEAEFLKELGDGVYD